MSRTWDCFRSDSWEAWRPDAAFAGAVAAPPIRIAQIKVVLKARLIIIDKYFEDLLLNADWGVRVQEYYTGRTRINGKLNHL
jgi:hypothetical protein